MVSKGIEQHYRARSPDSAYTSTTAPLSPGYNGTTMGDSQFGGSDTINSVGSCCCTSSCSPDQYCSIHLESRSTPLKILSKTGSLPSSTRMDKTGANNACSLAWHELEPLNTDFPQQFWLNLTTSLNANSEDWNSQINGLTLTRRLALHHAHVLCYYSFTKDLKRVVTTSSTPLLGLSLGP